MMALPWQSERRDGRSHRVFLTGSSGLLGTLATRYLRARGHRLRTVDRVPGRDTGHVLDLAEPVPDHLATGSDTLFHLASASDLSITPAQAERDVLAVAQSVIQLAELAQVHRLILASTCEIYGAARDGTAPITESRSPTPDTAYAEAKLATEALGAAWAARTGGTCLILRIGMVLQDKRRPDVRSDLSPWLSGLWLSHADWKTASACAVEAPHEGVGVYHMTSANPGSRVSIEAAGISLGYVPAQPSLVDWWR